MVKLWVRAERQPEAVVARIFEAAPCPLNSAAMTTAVQPSELVFEYASNGMDEINQVSLALESPGVNLFTMSACD